jgi:hypothetical protein
MLHIDLPKIGEFKELAAVRADACVSIYLPTAPRREAAHANRTALKDLVKEALNQLRRSGYDKRRLSRLAQHFGHLLGDDKDPEIEGKVRQRQRLHEKVDEVAEFWTYQSKGLGVLATVDGVRTFRLPHVVRPLAEVSDRFHLQPLIRALGMPHEAYVLGLSEGATRLIRVAVDMPPAEILVPQMPHNLPEGLRVYARAPSINLLLPEYEKVLMQEYVRKVDHALGAVLKGSDLPLILAADEPLVSMYRSVSTYPHLATEIIAGNPRMKTDRQISDLSLPILDRIYAREVEKIKVLYDDLKPRRATTDLSYAAHCATYGTIDQLVVDFDEVIPGLVDDYDGSVTYAVSDDAETYSVVDEVAKRALLTGARVLAARKDDLPMHAPLVAILRFPL